MSFDEILQEFISEYLDDIIKNKSVNKEKIIEELNKIYNDKISNSKYPGGTNDFISKIFILIQEYSLKTPISFFEKHNFYSGNYVLSWMFNNEIKVDKDILLFVLQKTSKYLMRPCRGIYRTAYRKGLDFKLIISHHIFMLHSSDNYDDFAKHVIDNFTDEFIENNPEVLYNCIGNDELFQALLDRGFSMKSKIDGEDLLIYCLFKKNIEDINFLLKYSSSVCTDKVKIEMVHYEDKLFDKLMLISSLENFDDFVNNNLLLIYCYDDCKDFLKTYC